MATSTTEISRDESPRDVAYDGFISYSHAADDLLAPRLQSGLQRFAKPWWKRRALRIFRDESSLSANPHLWSSITEALENSGWFVLLLSPDAASSEWVNEEIEYWREHKDPSRILPVLTEGTFEWAGGDVSGTAVPERLRGAFSEEPRWVDMRFARDEDKLDLKNPRFSAAVADIASALRGVPKDELESEEVRQHRRTIRTAWTAGVLVTFLAVAAVGLAIQSARNAEEARRQTRVAVAASLASASRAEMATDPELAVLLGVQSLREAETYEGSRALGEALLAHRAFLTLEPTEGGAIEGGGGVVPALAPEGDLMVILERSFGTAERLELFRMTDLVAEQKGDGQAVPVWGTAASDDVGFWIAGFSADGGRVIVFEGPEGVVDSEGQVTARAAQVLGSRRLVILDAESGEVTGSVAAPPCADPRPMASGRPIDVNLPLLLEVHPEVDGSCDDEAHLGQLVLLDLATGEVATVTEAYPLVGFGTGFPSLSRDGSRVAYAQGTLRGDHPQGAVIDLETGEVLLELEGGESMLSPDGRRVLTGSHEDSPLEMWDVDRAVKLREFQGNLNTADFSPDGELVYGGSSDGSIVLFDASTGAETLRLKGQESEPIGIAMDEEQNIVGSVAVDGSVWLWDISSRGIEAVGRPDLTIPRGRFLGIEQADDFLAATWTPDQSVFYGPKRVAFYDPVTSEMQLDIPGFLVAVSPGGRTAAIQEWSAEPTVLTATEAREMRCVGCDDPPGGNYWEVGALQLIDLETLSVIAEMPGLCRWLKGPTAELLGPDCGQDGLTPDWTLGGEFSPDGSLLAVSGASGIARVWDLASDEIVWESTKAEDTPSFPHSRAPVAFTPDGQFLFVSPFRDPAAVVVDTSTWEEVAQVPVEDSGFFTVTEFTPDGDLLLIGDSLHHVVVIDTSTWTRLEPLRSQSGNYLPTLDISPNGRLVATGGFDGTVWVWNLEDRSVERKMTVSANSPIWGVEFIDENSLLIVPDTGSQTWTGVFIPLDVETQIRDAITQLTRSFTPEECSTYNIVPCPTLEQLRND